MISKFPKRPNSDITAEKGINIVSTIINDQFRWIFRRTHQEHDYGVDAYVDFVTEAGHVTGKFIALQIKTGKSYLSGSESMYWYKDTPEHLNYFLNLSCPLVLIICDPDTEKCYWALLDKDKVDYNGGMWRHPIPRKEPLSIAHKKEVERLFGDVEDHLESYRSDLEILSLIDDESFLQYSVPKGDIKDLNTSNLKSFLTRITRNERLTRAVQSKLYIATYGYELDSREVHQIKEIRKWAKKARKKINEWYLCAGNTTNLSTLKWIAACSCNITSKPHAMPDGRKGVLIEGDSKEMARFVEECYSGLNAATEKWGWSKKYNYEISKLIHEELFPIIPYPALEDDSA